MGILVNLIKINVNWTLIKHDNQHESGGGDLKLYNQNNSTIYNNIPMTLHYKLMVSYCSAGESSL